MKKWISAVIVVAMSGAFVASCGDDGTTGGATSPTTTSPPAARARDYPSGVEVFDRGGDSFPGVLAFCDGANRVYVLERNNSNSSSSGAIAVSNGGCAK